MLYKDTLEQAANVRCRLQIAPLVEIVVTQTGPVGNDSTAVNRATQQQRGRRRAVIGAACAVDVYGPPEFGDDCNNGVVPGISKFRSQGIQAGIESGKAIGQRASRCALVRMRVPAAEFDDGNSWAIRRGQETRGRFSCRTESLNLVATIPPPLHAAHLIGDLL